MFQPMTARSYTGLHLRSVGRGVMLALSLLAFSASSRALFSDDEARRAVLELRKADEAQAAKFSDLNARVDQLSRSLLELNSQIEQLRSDLAQQRGQNEVLMRDLAETQRQQKDLQQGVNERVGRLEPQQITLDGKTFTAEPDEKRYFDEALATLREGNFDTAIAGLSTLLKRYPSTGYKESALYWLGNAQYGKRDYKSALTSFRTLLGNYPQHAKAPEAQLSIASCQVELKDQKGARRSLDELVKNYPASEAAQAARERLASLR